MNETRVKGSESINVYKAISILVLAVAGWLNNPRGRWIRLRHVLIEALQMGLGASSVRVSQCFTCFPSCMFVFGECCS